MTDETIKRLRELEAMATPGPWEARDSAIKGGLVDPEYPKRGRAIVAQYSYDSEFIAAMRNALPALLDAAERAAKLEAALEEIVYSGEHEIHPEHAPQEKCRWCYRNFDKHYPDCGVAIARAALDLGGDPASGGK